MFRCDNCRFLKHTEEFCSGGDDIYTLHQCTHDPVWVRLIEPIKHYCGYWQAGDNPFENNKVM